MHYELAQAVAEVLREGLTDALLSQRATTALIGLRDEFSWVRTDATTLVVESTRDRCRWWSFAGDRYNVAIANQIRVPGLRVSSDGLGVTIFRRSAAEGHTDSLRAAILAAQLDIANVGYQLSAFDASVDETINAMKFAECVPLSLLARLSGERFHPAVESHAMRNRTLEVRFES
jgi:hypothetical protein